MRKTMLLSCLTAALLLVPAAAAQTVRCESPDGRYRECDVAGFGAIALSRQVSDASCVEGRTWGTRNGRVWVDAGCRADFVRVSPAALPFSNVRCESIDGKRAYCAADTSGGVRLSRRLSDSSCEFGRQWGYDPNGVWVTSGCRADFSVRGNGTTTAALVSPRTIACASNNERREHCDAETRFGIALYRQVSDSPCVLNRTWGVEPDGIWVTEGCRGEFVVGDTHVASLSEAGAVAVPVPVPVPVVVESRAMTSSVLQPGNVVCESINNGRSHCRIDTTAGVSIVRQLSDNACVRDRTWGVDRDGVWVTSGCRAEFAAGLTTAPAPVTTAAAAVMPTLTCESIDGRRNHCPVNTDAGITLLRQISDSNCVLNQSWGVDAQGVWVTGGCRAEFIAGGNLPPDPRGGPASARVLCESENGMRKVCPADARLGVAVVRRISDAPCVMNSTWGFDTNGIWVTAGCRAEFILRR
jgi:hypothetical protein